MKVIGLTGGIASGKSTVSSIAVEFGIPVIDADQIAREIVAKGKPALVEIIEYFGNEVLNEKGDLNRRALGKIVFHDKKKLEELNRITHPRIIEEINNKIETCRNIERLPMIIVDAALLIETDMRKLVDEVWLVVADEKAQISRLMNRDGLSEEEAKERIQSQMSTSEKKKYADIIIENSGDLKHLKVQVKRHIIRSNIEG